VGGENCDRGHDKAGILSMVNTAGDNNGFEFYIHMGINEFFNGSSVVFGWWYKFYVRALLIGD
jgi:cyclophilin family peptidyl-prolyl cis-trans isomerase